jgi:hypothetical protein
MGNFLSAQIALVSFELQNHVVVLESSRARKIVADLLLQLNGFLITARKQY